MKFSMATKNPNDLAELSTYPLAVAYKWLGAYPATKGDRRGKKSFECEGAPIRQQELDAAHNQT